MSEDQRAAQLFGHAPYAAQTVLCPLPQDCKPRFSTSWKALTASQSCNAGTKRGLHRFKCGAVHSICCTMSKFMMMYKGCGRACNGRIQDSIGHVHVAAASRQPAKQTKRQTDGQTNRPDRTGQDRQMSDVGYRWGSRWRLAADARPRLAGHGVGEGEVGQLFGICRGRGESQVMPVSTTKTGTRLAVSVCSEVYSLRESKLPHDEVDDTCACMGSR